MSTKKPQTKKTYDARQAFDEGVMAGAEYCARSMSHTTGLTNPILRKLKQGTDVVAKSFEICKEFSDKRQEDWRVGNFASPTDATSSYFQPWKNGLAKFLVIDTHPSGTQGVECADGVLEMAIWWIVNGIPSRDPYNYLVPADKWAVA